MKTSELRSTVPVVPAAPHLPVALPVAFVGRGVRCCGGDGALVDDLHAGAPALSAPPAAGGDRHDTGFSISASHPTAMVLSGVVTDELLNLTDQTELMCVLLFSCVICCAIIIETGAKAG